MLRRSQRWLIACSVVALPVSSCGEDPRFNDTLSTLGTNGQIGQVYLLNVYVTPPLVGDRYLPGQEAVVRYTVFNDGDVPDRLLQVTSETAEGVRMHWDVDCDGYAEPVDWMPLPAQNEPPHVAPPGDERRGPYYLAMIDIEREVLAGTTIPLTFVFDRNGVVTIETLVRTEAEEAPMACTNRGTT